MVCPSRQSRKGFLLSVDAVIAIGLILTLAVFIGGLSMTYHSPELRYQRLYYASKDILMLLENARIDQLQEFDVVRHYHSTGVLTEDDMDKTLLDIIGSMWSSGNATLHDHASNITGSILNQTLAPGYNCEVVMGGDSIYSRGPDDGGFLARLSSLVSGVERGKPVDGYFARAYPSMVGGFRSQYAYFGGYVGQGNLSTYLELPDFDSIISVDMEMDAGGDFDLYVNGTHSGSYEESLNDTMRSERWEVDEAYYANLGEGLNVLEIRFPEGGSYIGGGYIKVLYNTTSLNATSDDEYGENAIRLVRLPGISGIMNLYSSFYVPGLLNSIEAFLHYDSDVPVTKYLSLGNITVFEDNQTGEKHVLLSSQDIEGNLSDHGRGLDYLSGMTCPVRLGMKNVTYILGEAGFADVVLITDRTGSMTSCDVDAECSSDLCDSTDPCHDRRSNVAVDTDSTFISTILEAEGSNYVGLIGYGERHGSTCSFHDISNDNSTLQERVGDYNYGGSWQECGWTCTSCGVAGATELLQEKETLYNLTLRQDIDRSLHELSGSSNPSDSISLNLPGLNKSRLVKSRLTIFARDEDPDNGYQQCLLLNGNYLGRVCKSSESSEDWHTCSYVVEPGWLNEGSNTVQITAGTQDDCFESGGYSWDAKDIRLMAWEHRSSQSARTANSTSGVVPVNSESWYMLSELWEHEDDYPNPVDFTSGLNDSGTSTFGLGSAADGWDWDDQVYGFSGTCDFNGESGGELELYTRYDSDDKSCAYGTEFEVTPGMLSLIQSGAGFGVSFWYEWQRESWWNVWESEDEAWVKARISGPAGSACEDPDDCYLGRDMDSGHSGRDSTPEVYAEDDPDNSFSGTFFQDISSWIDAAGTYYIDLGGKIRNSQSSERGYFRFDDIAAGIYNQSEPEARLSFPGVNMSLVKAATLRFQARGIDPEHYDCIYVNGYHIGMADYQEYSGSGDWENVSLDVNAMYLTEGENLIELTGGTPDGCNRTGDNDQWEARNLELELVHSAEHHQYLRSKSMLIMSDGEANTVIGDCPNYGSGGCPTVPGWLTPSEETVERACEAHDKFNISIYAIAFGNAGQDAIDMLQEAACCDNCTHFYVSNDADDLKEIYSQIAQGIINSSWANQTLEVTQDIGVISNLYPDSYIRLNYTSFMGPPEYGEIVYNFQTSSFLGMSGNQTVTDNATMTKEGWFFVPGNVEITEAKATSYSSQFWTDRLYVKNSSSPEWERVFWLGDYVESNYSRVGDPFTVNIPVEHIGSGNNSVRIGAGYGPENGTGGSPDTRIIYTGRLSGIALEGYSDVFPRAEGSTFTVHYDTDGDNVSDGSVTVSIGPNPSDQFDPMNDSIDNAFMRLMDSLNVVWDSSPGSIGSGTPEDPYDASVDNPIDFRISDEIDIDSAMIQGVPSLWGPVKIEVRVWN